VLVHWRRASAQRWRLLDACSVDGREV